MNECPDCGRVTGHSTDCPQYDVRTELVPMGRQPTSRALVPVDTLQPEQAQQFINAMINGLPKEFTIFVSYGRLFMGKHRGPAESQIMDAIMKLLSYNYQVVIEKDDPMMRLALKCTQLWRGGEHIEGQTMGKIIG